MEYLREDPCPERLAETIQRIEETVFDSPEVPVVPMGVAVMPFNLAGPGVGDLVDATSVVTDLRVETVR